MLTLLRIRHFTIIDELELELKSGLSVMTGETGAGKSILVDAVGLALGDRADSGVVPSGSRRAEISAVFEPASGHPALAWLEERGLEDDELVCLRRTISAEGRSRAFINNQPVTLRDLRDLGSLLVDIHGQHAHQSLLTAAAQRDLLDASGELTDLAAEVAAAWRDWRAASEALADRTTASDDRRERLELLRFQLGELEALDIQDNEHAELSAERDRLRNVDSLRQAIGQAADCLYESESGSAYNLTTIARRALEQAAEHDRTLTELADRLNSAEIELKEAAGELSRRLDGLEADPKRLDEVEARLDRMHQLARRHRVAEADLVRVAEELNTEIAALDAGAESVAALDAACAAAQQRYLKLARKQSTARKRAATGLAAAVTGRLAELGLPNARFEILLEAKNDNRTDSTGIDQIRFLVSTNPGVEPGPLDRVASGGELSRIGLALAVVATDAERIGTLVFDEVDAGIGGAVAEVVGVRLREIAASQQVLCVTHLPQVASQARHHYRIVKLTDGQTSRTQVRELNTEQRVEELSRMLGGVEITAATRAHAEEMMRRAAGA